MRGGWPEEAIRWENEVASVRSRSARVMMTLMRNGRDRRSENPRSATRGKNACLWLGPISGSHQGQQPNGCTQRPDTWLHPNASRKSQILFPCTAGAVHTWHLASFTAVHKISTRLEALRT